jgi:Fe2+ transport system protein FeoA
VAVGASGHISRVKVRDAERLQYLAARGVLPEKPFQVAGKSPFDGPIRLTLPAGECVLGQEMARVIWVEVDSAVSSMSDP